MGRCKHKDFIGPGVCENEPLYASGLGGPGANGD